MAENNKKSTDKRQTATGTDSKQETTADKTANRPKWSHIQVLCGLLLLVVGGLALLDSLNIADVDLFNILQLWPLAIVGLGLSILNLKGWASRLLTVLFIITVLASAVFVSLDIRPESETRQQAVDIETMEGISSARISYEGGAGSIDIDDQSPGLLARVDVETNFAELEHTVEREGDQQLIDIETKGSTGWWRGDSLNNVNLYLSKALPLELALDVGAADLQGDLSDLELYELIIDSGASNLDLRLGDKSPDLNVDIDAGASSIKLSAPEASGVRVELNRSLGSLELHGLQEVEEGIYETRDFEAAENQITISGDIGVANFELTRY